MSYASNDEIRGVLIETGQHHVLVTNATVAEMMSNVPIQPLADVPAWLLGQLSWQGWDVPLVSFARLAGLGEEMAASKNKVVVLKALGGNPARPYYALLTQNFPQLIAVPRDGLLADASEETLPTGVHMRVLLGEQSALLPDLDALESALDEAYPVAG